MILGVPILKHYRVFLSFHTLNTFYILFYSFLSHNIARVSWTQMMTATIAFHLVLFSAAIVVLAFSFKNYSFSGDSLLQKEAEKLELNEAKLSEQEKQIRNLSKYM